MRTHSTPSPALILNLSPSHLSPQTLPNGHESPSSSPSPSPSPTIPRETVAIVHAPPGSCKKASKSHSTALIEFLPDPVILQIFAHLSTPQLCRCARVCRHWYSLAWDPRLWRTIRLSGELLHADRALKVLTQRLCQDTPNICLTLEMVVASGCPRLSDRGLRVLAQCCPELRHLEMAGCYNISNEAVFDIVSRCPNLEHLDVSGKQSSIDFITAPYHTTSQFHGPLFEPEESWVTVYAEFCYVLPMSVWDSSRFSGFLVPPENVPVGQLAKLNCPKM